MILLDRRRSRALESLLVAPSVAQAARTSGLSTRALWRYLAEPTFNAALREHRTRAIRQAETVLASAAGEAVATLRDMLTDADRAVALGAARALVPFAFKAAEQGDLEERLRALETRLTAPERAGTRQPPGLALVGQR